MSTNAFAACPESMSIRVLLVDDHELLRTGVRHALSQTDGIQVVGEAGSLAEADARLRDTQPDVVLLDLMLPDGEGLSLLKVCQEHAPDARVVILSAHQGPDWTDRSLRAGCAGYVDKTAGIDEIIAAVQSVARGRTVISVPGNQGTRSAYHAVDPSHRHETPAAPHEAALSDREQEVLSHIAQGKTNQEAADAMFLSVKTVETYRSRLIRKLGVRSRADLFKHAQDRGIIAPENPLSA